MKLPAWLGIYTQERIAATAVEYAIMVAGVAMAIVVVLFLLGDSVALLFEGMVDSIQSFTQV